MNTHTAPNSRRLDPIPLQSPPLDLVADFQNAPPPVDMVLPGFIAGTVGGLVAPGAAGKSWWSLQASFLIAAGIDLLDLTRGDPESTPPTGPVVMVLAEDPPISIRHRLHALAQRLEPEERERVAENLTIQPVEGQRINILDPRWQATLSQLAEGCRLLVLDTLRRVHDGDENSSSEMAAVIAAMEQIAAESGASVLFLHHSSKAAAWSGQLDYQQGARGSSVLTDNTRWQSYLVGMSREEAEDFGIGDDDRWRYCRWGVSKQNYGPPLIPIWYERTHAGLVPVRMIRRDKPTGRWRTERLTPLREVTEIDVGF